MSDSPIRTTVVGSYPVPTWLATQPSKPNLRDAILTVLKTQELVGLDVVADGELSRFNISHPETNGMIDYFIAPMSGIDTTLSREELVAFRAQERTTFRSQPAGVVRDTIGEGLLNLPADWESVKTLGAAPMKFTVTSPYMLAKTLLDKKYGDLPALTMDIAKVLKQQVEAIDALNHGESVVVSAPTGSGKTLIGEYAIHRAIGHGQKVFYTTPLKALSNQKLRNFRAKFGSKNVGLMTGDLSVNRNASILVMTTEIFRNMLCGGGVVGAQSDPCRTIAGDGSGILDAIGSLQLRVGLEP